MFQRWLIPLLGLCSLAVLPACNRSEQIEHYTVLKPPPIESRQVTEAPPLGEPKDRTLAAIVPFGSKLWFFKLTGPKDLVATRSDAFAGFVKSVHFSAEEKPEWTLPEGWQRQDGGSDIRYATLMISGVGESLGKPLEVTVTALTKPEGDNADYILSNVNRWRGQLQLPPISKEQMPAETTQIELTGATATQVDLLGTASGKPMGGPFSGGARDGK